MPSEAHPAAASDKNAKYGASSGKASEPATPAAARPPAPEQPDQGDSYLCDVMMEVHFGAMSCGPIPISGRMRIA